MSDTDKIERIKKMLETEEETIARHKLEVTADYPSVVAEHRAACLHDVLKLYNE